MGKSNGHQHENTLILADYVHKKDKLAIYYTFQITC